MLNAADLYHLILLFTFKNTGHQISIDYIKLFMNIKAELICRFGFRLEGNKAGKDQSC